MIQLIITVQFDIAFEILKFNIIFNFKVIANLNLS